MPVSNTAQTPTQNGGPGTASPQSLSLPGAQTNLFAGMQAPTFSFGNLPQNPTADFSTINSLLTRTPTSLSSMIGPYLQQLYGTSAGLTQGIFQQQGAQGAAQAQSDAGKRGLTGSSIESANISGAYNSANQGFNQYLAQLLPQLGQQTQNAAQFDIGQQNDAYNNLAQALGQQYASGVQRDQFGRQLNANESATNKMANSQMWGSIIGGAGMLGAGALMSDARLKENAVKIGKLGPLNVYRYNYKQKTPFDLPKGEQIGVMGHEAAEHYPHVVSVDRGYLKVNYSHLFEEFSDA